MSCVASAIFPGLELKGGIRHQPIDRKRSRLALLFHLGSELPRLDCFKPGQTNLKLAQGGVLLARRALDRLFIAPNGFARMLIEPERFGPEVIKIGDERFGVGRRLKVTRRGGKIVPAEAIRPR